MVTPAVLYMCAEDAPNGKIIQAGNGRFSAAAVFSNDGVNQGANASYESFLDDQEIIMDLSTAEEGWAFRRKQKVLLNACCVRR